MSGLQERIEALAERWDEIGGVLGAVAAVDLRAALAADTTPAGDCCEIRTLRRAVLRLHALAERRLRHVEVTAAELRTVAVELERIAYPPREE